MNYSCCNQTITLYHVATIGRDRQYRRTVIRGVFFENSKNYSINKTGLSGGNSFTCIIPQNRDSKRYLPPISYSELVETTNQYTINPQDRIVLGECEKEFELNDTSWAGFKTNHMVVVKSIDEKYYHGKFIHLEVGG